jgi:hypothetical protein
LKLKNLTIAVSTLGMLVVGYHLASAVMVARAVLPRQTSTLRVLHSVFDPPYKMAAPHRSLYQEIRVSLVGTAYACGTTPDCDGTKAMAVCAPGCPVGFCKCPDCQINGCTVYSCRYTTVYKTLCDSRNGVAPCTLCEDAFNVSCKPI